LRQPPRAVGGARLLSNGRYTVLATAAGTGCSRFDDIALTAWSADPTEDADGCFIYVRDIESGVVWSVGAQPMARAAERYETSRRPGVATIVRLDDGIETTTELCVVPDDDVELRRIRLRNLSGRTRRLEVTSYAEVVLNQAAAHAAHPGFSKLFVQTAYAAEVGAVLARRRPRSSTERTGWMVHALAGGGPVEHETDRVRFLGRGRTAANPAAFGVSLSGTTGNVLDPVFALRRTITLPAGGQAELTLVGGAGDTRERVIGYARRYASPTTVESAFAQAEDGERTLLSRLGIEDHDAARFDDLAVAVEYGDPALTAGATGGERGQGVLARLGLSPARRLLVVEAAEIATAISYWQAKCVHIETLLLSDHPTGAASAAGCAVRPRADVSAADLGALRALGHPVVSGASLCAPEGAPRRPARVRAASLEATPRPADGGLLFDNGYGGFGPDGSEYVIRVGTQRPPVPWVNVVANERFGFLVSEAGAGYTWSRNSRENRLTPWSNDPVADPHGEALYLRDEDDGAFWSPLPGPVAPPAAVEARHGFGYSTWSHTSRELAQDVCMFVPRADPVRIVRVRLTNTGARPRHLSVFSYARLVLGVLPAESGRSVETWLDAESTVLCARNPLNGDFAGAIVFAAAVAPDAVRPVHVTGDRTAFLGRHGTPGDPAALHDAATLDGRTGAGLDPCAALQVSLAVAPGATVECDLLLGEAATEDEALALVARYRQPRAISQALDEVRGFWRTTLSAVRVETPSPGLDLMLNGWLVYQNMSCRLWGRSAFYQSGGAFGFRDQLQDSAALVYTRPDLTRAQIVLHAGHQFVEGDVLHWWHPPADRGTRTRFSDDLVWLPYVTAFYVGATGDASVLDEMAPFLTARLLAPGEDEVYLLPSLSGESADVYAHCCRALDRSLTRGMHGLPLMGTGDWNDGMNRVGREGRGESTWLGFFLYLVLGEFLPLCERRGDGARVARYREYRESLRAALESAGWDGAWYRRAYYDDGTPLGSAVNDECRIDALAQAWAVISKAAPPERAALAMDAVERELVDEQAGFIRLLAPPFDQTAHDPGYIKGYVPGIRENGGQYTHAALWVIRALAELGRRERAATLLEMIGPVAHTTPAALPAYQVEPYVVVADIYSTPPHVGRGGWTWYTGSAGWMYRVALESVLGLTLHGGTTLRIAPRVPDAWPRFGVSWRLADGKTRYEVEVLNPARNAAAVVGVTVDGRHEPIEDGAAVVPLVSDGAIHRVVATMGAGAGR
jgi:cellobiose phosphorylase